MSKSLLYTDVPVLSLTPKYATCVVLTASGLGKGPVHSDEGSPHREKGLGGVWLDSIPPY